jgi:uncharacterized protein YdhG (YjbR/CyaY superfamily)
MSGNDTVDDYIARQPEAAQVRLRELRAVIRSVMPSAVESISYSVPTYKSGPTRVYFGAGKRHCALYATAMHLFADELAAYNTSKGTIRFPLDRPIPEDLVHRLVEATVAEREAAHKQKR